ncbi:putative malate:quinone oxidoreductase [compost metagenome]
MLEVIKKCFPQHLKAWEPKIKEMIPSYGLSLSENPHLFRQIDPETAKALGLTEEKRAIVI